MTEITPFIIVVEAVRSRAGVIYRIVSKSS